MWYSARPLAPLSVVMESSWEPAMHQAMLSGARTTSRCSARCGSSWMRRCPPVTRPWTMPKSKLSMALRSAESSCVCIGLGASARGGARDGVAGGTGVGEGWFAGGDVCGGVAGDSGAGEGWLADGLTGVVIARGEWLLSGRPAWRGEEMPLGVLGRGLLLGRCFCRPSSWACESQLCLSVRRRVRCLE